MRIAPGEVRFALPLPDGLLEHPIGALARALHEAAARECVCYEPVSRCLFPEDVLGGDPWWKPARAHNLDTTWVLTNEHGPRQAVVAMADRVQERLADCDLVER